MVEKTVEWGEKQQQRDVCGSMPFYGMGIDPWTFTYCEFTGRLV